MLLLCVVDQIPCFSAYDSPWEGYNRHEDDIFLHQNPEGSINEAFSGSRSI